MRAISGVSGTGRVSALAVVRTVASRGRIGPGSAGAAPGEDVGADDAREPRLGAGHGRAYWGSAVCSSATIEGVSAAAQRSTRTAIS